MHQLYIPFPQMFLQSNLAIKTAKQVASSSLLVVEATSNKIWVELSPWPPAHSLNLHPMFSSSHPYLYTCFKSNLK